MSIIDAHAGTLGTLGASGVSGEVADFDRRIALIGGTSTGHMAISAHGALYWRRLGTVLLGDAAGLLAE